jgi:hypothetical protein
VALSLNSLTVATFIFYSFTPLKIMPAVIPDGVS